MLRTAVVPAHISTPRLAGDAGSGLCSDGLDAEGAACSCAERCRSCTGAPQPNATICAECEAGKLHRAGVARRARTRGRPRPRAHATSLHPLNLVGHRLLSLPWQLLRGLLFQRVTRSVGRPGLSCLCPFCPLPVRDVRGTRLEGGQGGVQTQRKGPGPALLVSPPPPHPIHCSRREPLRAASAIAGK